MFKQICDKLSYWYFFYTILSNVYFLEPVERWICNAMLVAFVGLVVYTSCVYLPGHSVMMLHAARQILGFEDEEEAALVN